MTRGQPQGLSRGLQTRTYLYISNETDGGDQKGVGEEMR